MKKLLLTLLLIVSCLISSFLYAQDSLWIEQPVPFDSGSVNGIMYIDSVSAWAVGRNTETNKAIIMNTSNGGDLWTIQNESMTGTLNKVFMNNAQSGYAVGQEWVDGYIAVLNTTEGTTWSNQTLPQIHGSLHDVFFTNNQHGCAVGVNHNNDPGKALIIYTEDGSTWQEAIYPVLENIFLEEVTFTNDNEGWCVGSTLSDADSTFILHSTDGGKNWQKVDHPITNGSFGGMTFISPDTGFFYGMAADTTFVMQTNNRGQNWEFIPVAEDIGSNLQTKSSIKTTENCRQKVVNFDITYVDNKWYPFARSYYGWRIVVYYNCPNGKKYEYQRVVVHQGADGSTYMQILGKETLQEMIVTKGVQVPSGDNTPTPINPEVSICGTTTEGKPTIVKSKPEIIQYVKDNVFHVDMTNTDSVVLCVNNSGEITVNDISSGIIAKQISSISVNGKNQKSVKIDLKCLKANMFPYPFWITVFSGTGGGSHKIIGSTDIPNFITGRSGHTMAEGGSKNDTFYRDGAAIEFIGFGGNDKLKDISQPNSSKSANLYKSISTIVSNVFTDELGNDTLSYKDYGWPVIIDLDLQQIGQTISDEQNLELNGQFENFIGSAFDDKITVKPLIDESRFIDGGIHENGDTLVFDAMGEQATDDGATITVEGYMPVNYVNIEHVVITNLATSSNEINLPDNSFELNVYPNPFSSSLTIISAVEANVLIYSINGQAIKQKKLQKNEQYNWLPDSFIPSGIYFIKAVSVKNVATKTVVLKR